jgi:ankyrin repeat protein
MNKIVLILLAVIIGYISYQFFLPTNKVKMKHAPETYFKSKKVQKFCYALIKNDFETTDKLLKKGLDINAIGDKVKNERKNEYAPTPLTWLFLSNKDTPEKLKAFEYLLDNGADPMIIFEKYGTTMLFEAAGYEYPDYLKLILKSKQIKKKDLNIDLNSGTMNTPLLHANAVNRFENFNLLLDAGADIDLIEERTDRTTLHYCAMDGDWKYAYELLTRGVDYSQDLEDIVLSIGIKNSYSPVTAINWDGVDDRQKVVQFFRDKGVEIKPGMNPGEKYVSERGEDILYVKGEIYYAESLTPEEREKGEINKWIKFRGSIFDKHITKDPDEQHYLDEEIEKLKIETLK